MIYGLQGRHKGQPSRGKPPKKTRKKRKRRSKTAYQFFCAEHQAVLIKDSPEMTFADRGKAVGRAWRKLSPAEKQPYHDKASEAKMQASVGEQSAKKKAAAGSAGSAGSATPVQVDEIVLPDLLTAWEKNRLSKIESNEAKLADLSIVPLLCNEVLEPAEQAGSKRPAKAITEATLNELEGKIERRMVKALDQFAGMVRSVERTPAFGEAKVELLHINELLASNKGKKIGKQARRKMRRLLGAKLVELCPFIYDAVLWVCAISCCVFVHIFSLAANAF